MQATTNVSVKNSLTKAKRKHSRGSRTNLESIKLPDELVELIKEDVNHSNYVGGVIAVVVIVFLLGLIALATYITMDDSSKPNIEIPFYFSDIFKMVSMHENFEFEWKKEALLFRNSSGDLCTIDVLDIQFSKTSVLLPKQYYQKGMKASSDLSAWFIPGDHKKIETLQDVFQFKLMIFLNNKPFYQQLQIDDNQGTYFHSISWGPREKNMVAVHQGNIYYSENPFIKTSFVCLSCSLIPGKLYGHFIGYYAKRIFKTEKAYWWSADGKRLAFLAIAEEADKLALVEIFKFRSLFTQFSNVSYSKAGLSSPPYDCQIYAVSLGFNKVTLINLPKFVPFKPYFLIHVQWYNSSSMLISVLSWEQNRAAILFCFTEEENCFVVLEQAFSTGWINLIEYQSILTLESQSSIVIAITTSDLYSAKRHLATVKIERQSKNIIKWLTIGNNYVLKLYTLDSTYKNVFYLATNSNSTSKHLYRTNIENMNTECVTCHNTTCNRNEIYFSENRTIFLQECQNVKPKVYHLNHLNQENWQIDWSRNVQWNQIIVDFLVNKSLPRVEYLPIQLADNHKNYQILMKIHLPKHLNPAHVTKYPVLLLLPDDPYNTNIKDDSNLGWIEYLSSFLNFVVIQMEVRGAENHYFSYHTSLMNNLGINDYYDIMNGLKIIFHQRKYLDNSSIGVIGQNYGGYLAVKLLYDHDDHPNFRCGAAINPITDFSLYDSFFTERYFGKFGGSYFYHDKSMYKFSTNSSLKEFILIHEMNQNDILYENSAKLIKILIEQNILFDYVPHYGSYSDTFLWNRDEYVLKKITTFLTDCFNKSSVKYSLLANKDFHSF